MDRRLVGSLLIVASAAGFGSGALFAKGVYATTEIGFMTLMAWRFLLGAAATWAWIAASASRRAAARRTSRSFLAVGFALGLLYVGNSGTYYAGLERVPASLAALIVFVYPAIVAVLSLRFGRRLEGRRAWGALGLALVGSALTIGGIEAGQVPPLEWLLLVAASPVIYACWIILQAWFTGERAHRDRAAGDTDATVAGALVNTGAMTGWWAIALAFGQPLAPAEIPGSAWPFFIGIGIFSTFIAIVGFTEGSRRMGAAQASLVSTVEPLWTITLGALLLHEHLTPMQLVGGALILAGVVIAQAAPMRAATRRSREAGEGAEAALSGALPEGGLLRIADE